MGCTTIYPPLLCVMKDIWNRLQRFFSIVFEPIRQNAMFFVFMFALGMVCTWIELPSGKNQYIYPHSAVELLLDLFLLCLLLAVIPRRVRKYTRGILTALLYTVALADTFCFVKYGSPITPSILMLVGETNSREAGEFLSGNMNFDMLFSPFGWLLLIAFAHILTVVFGKKIIAHTSRWRARMPHRYLFGIALSVLIAYAVIVTYANKAATWRLMSYEKPGEMEHELTKGKESAQLYSPLYRLFFSIRANQLAARQIEKLIEAKDNAKVDSCSFTSPNIVLIIGESYNKQHAGLYGYEKNTTPLQSKRAQRELLIPFEDVVAPWNLTSFVFKLLFSMYTVDRKGEWCDYPLFPQLFRKAGYRVTFITNQFLPKAKEAVYDFSGGFFLNHPELSEAMFDVRNDSLYTYDEGLLQTYDRMLAEGKLTLARSPKKRKETLKEGNLIIFHLMGQHMEYNKRYPKGREKFGKDDYDRPDLKPSQLRTLAAYDNAVVYNDSIVDQIIRRFEDEEAIVIYVPDHGEECFDGILNKAGRQHLAKIDARLAREEFHIPFWIWCSHSYAVKHPDIYGKILDARKRPLMTDALAHMLLFLGGIHTRDYIEKYNILSPNFDEKRPRLLKMQTDYNQLDVRK